MKFDKQ